MWTTSFFGDRLIGELRSRDGLVEDDARAWIEEMTGFEFDPDAMYSLSWVQHKETRSWTKIDALRVRIMTDPELHRLEVQSVKSGGGMPRKPWEDPPHKRAYGRAEAAKRVSSKRRNRLDGHPAESILRKTND